MLVEYFVHRYATRAGKHIESIDKRTLDLLQSYDWPGNIRELQNVIERSVILCSGAVFSVDESWLSKDSAAPISRTIQSISLAVADPIVFGDVRPLAEVEREYINSVVRAVGGNRAQAAAKLGIGAATLYRKLKEYRGT